MASLLAYLRATKRLVRVMVRIVSKLLVNSGYHERRRACWSSPSCTPAAYVLTYYLTLLPFACWSSPSCTPAAYLLTYYLTYSTAPYLL
eukprot:scaffold116513_cov57-Phaeocystis_antarctica.AAC.2